MLGSRHDGTWITSVVLGCGTVWVVQKSNQGFPPKNTCRRKDAFYVSNHQRCSTLGRHTCFSCFSLLVSMRRIPSGRGTCASMPITITTACNKKGVDSYEQFSYLFSRSENICCHFSRHLPNETTSSLRTFRGPVAMAFCASCA